MKTACGRCQTFTAILQDRVARDAQSLGDLLPLGRHKRTQHIIGHGLTAFRTSNPQTNPGEIPGAQMCGHGFEPIVTGQSAGQLETNRAQWEIEFIMGNKNTVRGNPVFPAQFSHDLTAQIHEGQRFDDDPAPRAVVLADIPQLCIEARAAGGADSSRLTGPVLEQMIREHETEIVPGPGILCARITQTYYQAFICHGEPSEKRMDGKERGPG